MMKDLMVITAPEAIPAEISIINDLFAAGLQVLHLRKPHSTAEEIATVLDGIDKRYRSCIALHQAHQLADAYGIQRLHFPEQLRKQRLAWLKVEGFTLSTSIHRMEDVQTLPDVFEYTFYGPVFPSISKLSYDPKELVRVPEHKNIEVIAIGGVDEQTIQEISAMGYDGAACLGAIWEKPEEAVNRFKAIQRQWQQHAITY